MKALERVAWEAVTAAVQDKPTGKGSLACVKAGEVVMLCDLVPQADRDQVVNDLRLGASNAQLGTGGWVNVFINADQLRHLLEKIPAG